MAERNKLYFQVVTITSEYLGPAADRFVSRQIESHLHIKPTQLNKTNLSSLLDWIQAAMTILTDDDHLVHEYLSRLEGLTRRDAAVSVQHNDYYQVARRG